MSASKLQSWECPPRAPQSNEPLVWRDTVRARLLDARASAGTTLPCGGARGSADSSLSASGHVLPLHGLARFIDADWEQGIVRAEAGMTLGELIAITLPRGWMLPVIPGTQLATLGGALANDVHGRNHQLRGTFGRHVRRFSLLRSDRPAIECAADDQPDLFSATIAGLGLTGVIEWVEIQLMAVRSSHLNVTRMRFGNLDDFLALSRGRASTHEYGAAWVDCLARGNAPGRGIYVSGNHSTDGDLSLPAQRTRGLPFAPPAIVPNHGLAMRTFNALYYWRQRRGIELARVDPASFLSPLDKLRNGTRHNGNRAYQQHQYVLPEASARDALQAILQTIAAGGSGSYLAVLERCGALASPGLLSFPMRGVSLTLNFAQDARHNTALFARLAAIVAEARGRQFPATHAQMNRNHFRSAYPAWQELERHRDPALMSRFWKRITES
ncbi:MAG TPA: FAD-binding oxidoreductase [Paraburkholderia sp.]|jgi:FAD/FMN-containing dehydrogenase|uniref:FAD-binding oxidoreductase n=1 Tax=Paraburkholderia sp. TaxID=1926495 RepID=UPI002DF41E8B|nr:FAD-binding oxidoreductase [Paraburkholderia sp.]